MQRVSTFVNWPKCDETSSTALARLGFRYEEDSNTLGCSCCNIQLHPDSCSIVEDILRKHQELSPRCPFVSANTEEDVQQSANFSRFSRTTASDYSRIDETNPGFGRDLTSAVATTSANSINGTLRSQPRFDELCFEAVRLSTFRDWPLQAKARPQVLARNGFFYGGAGEGVQCAFCNGRIGNWGALDEPSVKHKSLFPDCRFVCGFDVGNIPLVRDRSPSRCFNWNTTIPASRSPLEASSFQHTSLSQSAQNLDAARYSEYADIERRVESFRNRGIVRGQTPEALAEAGFFYIGPMDRTQCFNCGGILRDWEPEDNPIHEHRRWFERCAFVKCLPIETKQHASSSSVCLK